MELIIPVLFVVGLSENQGECDACDVAVLGLGSSCTPDRSFVMHCAEQFANGYQWLYFTHT